MTMASIVEGRERELSLIFIKALASAKLRLIVDGTVPYPPNVIEAAKDELNSRGEMWETNATTASNHAKRLEDVIIKESPLTGARPTAAILDEVAAPAIESINSTLDIQFGGDHYKMLGNYQPWEVLKVWLTEEEFRGFMKGTAIVYLAREKSKGKDMDISKAVHTLQGFQELAGVKDADDKR